MPSLSLFENDPTTEDVPPGHVFLDVGDPGDVMYIVMSGEVDLRLRGRLLETVGHGGFFGELALIDHKPRSATAVAKSPVRTVRVDQRRFLYLVQNQPFFAIEIMAVMSGRLRHADELINPKQQ